MKKILVTLTVAAFSTLSMFGQGRVLFNNYIAAQNPITVNAVNNMGPIGGAGGAYVGADYSVQLLWKAGVFANQAAFDAALPSSSATFAFFGATGGSPGVDGAGLFDGGQVNMGGPGGTYTMQIRAWFNDGVNLTYAAALGANANTGLSALTQVAVTESPTLAPNLNIASFTVGAAPVPEPTSLALAGLGAAALLVFRRRK